MPKSDDIHPLPPRAAAPPAPRSPVRRQVLAGAILAGLAAADTSVGAAPATAAEGSSGGMLGGPGEYARERGIALERGQPLLLFFSLAGCVFCEALRADQLRHAYSRRERLGIRAIELRMDDEQPIPGLAPTRSPQQIAGALRVRVAPTVVFLDGDREVAERLVGYASPGFYGAYLDERIMQSRANTVSQRPPP